MEHLRLFLREELQEHRLIGVGHRVVHGGLDYTAPVRVDARVLKDLERFNPLAPLHQPHNLSTIAMLMDSAPDLPQVACFDTSFHRTNPEVAQRFALPADLHEAGVRRYGFHGLSYEYIASVLPRFDAKAAAGKTIVLHLGNGSSMCAMQAGRSVANTMGFTAVEGLPMGTRCGSIDPGVILYLMDERGMDARAVERLIYTQSGLLGMSGISSDMRTLLESADPRARTRHRRLRVPHPARARLARRRAGRARRAGLHGRRSARTRHRSAHRPARVSNGSGSSSIRPPMRPAAPGSARRRAASAPGSFPPTRS